MYEINPIWAAEFRGFFFGDGYLGITRNGIRHGRAAYTARAQITLRGDDREVLLDIQAHLGGMIYDYQKEGKTFVVWRTRSSGDLGRVLNCLEGGILPAKKRFEIPIVRQFCETVQGNKNLSSEIDDLRRALCQEIKQLHAGSPPNPFRQRKITSDEAKFMFGDKLTRYARNKIKK